MVRDTRRRVLRGTVVSDKMDKTIVVETATRKSHPLYGKRVKYSRKFKAHDELNEAKIGDIVEISDEMWETYGDLLPAFSFFNGFLLGPGSVALLACVATGWLGSQKRGLITAWIYAVLPLPAAVILVGISVLLTLISGLIPSRSAAKKDPVVALRSE